MLLGNGGYQRIGGVDHVAHVQSACLGEQLVGIPTIVAVFALQPQDQLGVRDAGRVFHGTGAADHHDRLLRLDTRPLYGSGFDHFEDHGHPGGDLQDDPTEFSLPLPGVAVTGVDERAGIPYWQIDRVTRLHVGHVHVASEGARREGGDRFQVWCHGQGSQERLPGQSHTEFLVGQLCAAVYEIPDPDPLGQRLLQRAGEVRRGEAAEVGDQDAHGEVSCGLDALDANGKGVARFGSLHVDGPGLRIEELGRGKGTARKVFLTGYPALEGIIGLNGHPFSRLHPRYGLPIRVEDVAVVVGYYLHRVILVGLHSRSSSCCSRLTVSHVLHTGTGRFIVAFTEYRPPPWETTLSGRKVASDTPGLIKNTRRGFPEKALPTPLMDRPPLYAPDPSWWHHGHGVDASEELRLARRNLYVSRAEQSPGPPLPGSACQGRSRHPGGDARPRLRRPQPDTRPTARPRGLLAVILRISCLLFPHPLFDREAGC